MTQRVSRKPGPHHSSPAIRLVRGNASLGTTLTPPLAWPCTPLIRGEQRDQHREADTTARLEGPWQAANSRRDEPIIRLDAPVGLQAFEVPPVRPRDMTTPGSGQSPPRREKKGTTGDKKRRARSPTASSLTASGIGTGRTSRQRTGPSPHRADRPADWYRGLPEGPDPRPSAAVRSATPRRSVRLCRYPN